MVSKTDYSLRGTELMLNSEESVILAQSFKFQGQSKDVLRNKNMNFTTS